MSSRAPGDIGFATRAQVALNANRIPEAIDFAEKAVAKSPSDAGFRALLGNAYFAGGRFRSAEAAYKDALSIYPDQAQVMLKLALVQIALGKKADAIATLKLARPALGDSNYGLALALAGRTSEAIRVLEPAARQTNADATVRQNLALAYAFAGNWDNARAIAAQDVPAGQLDTRIHQWMQLASPKSPAEQVAALVGVTPAAVDEGQPVRLALAHPDTQLAQAAPQAPVEAAVEALVAAPVAVAAAPVAAAAAPVAPAPVVVASVPPAPPPSRPTLATLASSAVAEAKAVLASVMPHHPAPVAKPKPRVVVAAAARRGNSPAVVQLGAYGSPDRVLAAWNGSARIGRPAPAWTGTSQSSSCVDGSAISFSVNDLSDYQKPPSLRIVLSADLSGHPHRPLPQLRRIPPRRTTCHDSNPPNKWSLRTSLGLFT